MFVGFDVSLYQPDILLSPGPKEKRGRQDDWQQSTSPKTPTRSLQVLLPRR